MSDCANAEMREWLPELLHGRLDGDTRTRVEAHVRSCSDCAAELELLEAARASLRMVAPAAIDTRAIVAALPRPRARKGTRTAPFGRAWRIAAAITVLALGGLSVNALRGYMSESDMAGIDSTATRPGSIVATADTPVAARRVGVTAGLGVTDLADEDLEALIGALDQLEAAPHVDPDANRLGRMVGGTTGGD